MRCVTRKNGRKVNKTPFNSKTEARAALRAMCNRKGLDINRFNVYRCRVCHKYHSGKIPEFAYD